MNKMRLLFVHEKFGAFAGAEANILATADGLGRRGHTLGLLHGVPTGKSEAAWREAFPSCFSLEADGDHSGVARVLEEFNPDVVYLHKLSDLEPLAALLASGVPLVRMVHDHDLYCMRSYKYNFFTRCICERALSPFCVLPCGAFIARDPDADFPLKWVSYTDKRREIELNQRIQRLVVGSQFMKTELVRNGFAPDRIEIHPPVPVSGDASVQSRFSERNRILYTGQIVRGKGVDVLLESLAQVRVPFQCFIFGDGNHRVFCEKLSRRLGLADRVHFKGYVPPEELKIFYREASAVLVSSVWPEPFGAAGLEGMRYGLPVIAFDAGGIKEWLMDGHNGFLVPWMDRAAFAARVAQLLCDKPLARRLGEQGCHMVARQFDFSRYLDGLEGLFARVAGENQHPAITHRVENIK